MELLSCEPRNWNVLVLKNILSFLNLFLFLLISFISFYMFAMILVIAQGFFFHDTENGL